MPYLTPDSLPEGTDCRSLQIPASSEWLALVTGALTELTKKWNWEQYGSVTVDQAVSVMETMISAYFAGCSGCILPGGYRATRIGVTGHLQTLDDNGEWQDATGDYTYPQVTPREGGTEQDQICLAASNAASVFEQAYEQITEAYASELTAAEALTALIEWFIIAVGGEAAPFAFAIALFLIPVFVLAYEALDTLTQDLWDSTFTEQFTCMLIDCATNTDGVITFDWDCMEHALYARTYSAGLNDAQLLLYMQINFIVWSLGGVDAINAAGATTGITEADCSFCEGCPTIFRTFDFTAEDGYVCGWFGLLSDAADTHWLDGIGFRGYNGSNPDRCFVVFHTPDDAPTYIYSITFRFTAMPSSGDVFVGFSSLTSPLSGDYHYVYPASTGLTEVTWICDQELTGFVVGFERGGGDTSYVADIVGATLLAES